MTRFLSILAMVMSSLVMAQISLIHTIEDSRGKSIVVNEDSNDFFYLQRDSISLENQGRKLHILNEDFSVRKSINIPNELAVLSDSQDYANRRNANLIPRVSTSGYGFAFISKGLFNDDDLYDFLVPYYNYVEANDITQYEHKKVESGFLIIDENGTLVHKFPFESVYFYDKNTRKIGRFEYEFIYNKGGEPYLAITETIHGENEYGNIGGIGEKTKFYSLPKSKLNTQEKGNKITKLTAYPNPVKTTLNIVNPKNNHNIISILDISGRVIKTFSFPAQDEIISVNVGTLPKGNYLYKIGSMAGKFVKD